MSTIIIRPEKLSHQQLDKLLALGWFRMGQLIFTCHYIFFDKTCYSPMWLRLQLENYEMSKSLRKINRKNRAAFQISVQKAVIDEAKNDLFLRHKKRFKGYKSATLQESLLDQEEHNIYDTYEVTVHDGDLLIAASFFDVGENSATSIMGIFDPAYSKFSLGLFTMLVEIEYGIATGRDLYYPGYFVPKYPVFDYKLRLGKMEYFYARDRTWFPFEKFKNNQTPIHELRKKLRSLKKTLNEAGVKTKILNYPLFDKGSFDGSPQLIQSPIFLSIKKTPATHVIVDYDAIKNKYRLFVCKRYPGHLFDSWISILQPFSKRNTCFDFLSADANGLGVYEKEEDIAKLAIAFSATK